MFSYRLAFDRVSRSRLTLAMAKRTLTNPNHQPNSMTANEITPSTTVLV